MAQDEDGFLSHTFAVKAQRASTVDKTRLLPRTDSQHLLSIPRPLTDNLSVSSHSINDPYARASSNASIYDNDSVSEIDDSEEEDVRSFDQISNHSGGRTSPYSQRPTVERAGTETKLGIPKAAYTWKRAGSEKSRFSLRNPEPAKQGIMANVKVAVREICVFLY